MGKSKSGRESLIPIVRDVIKHAKAGTIKQANKVMQLPAIHYTDSNRFKNEVEKVIKKPFYILAEDNCWVKFISASAAVLALPSVLVYTFFIAFGFSHGDPVKTNNVYIITQCLEVIYGLEIITHFFTAFKDPETF